MSLNRDYILDQISGWVRTTDVTPQGSGTVSSKTYDDSPNNTILSTALSSTEDITVHLEASYPNVDVEGVTAVLPKVGDIYAGTVDVTIAVSGLTRVTSKAIAPDGLSGSTHEVDVTVDAPPQILTLSFADQGGGAGAAGPGNTYPGAQTELKAGDQVRVEGTTDKACDAIQVSDFEAGTNELVTFASTTSFSALITIADRGTSVQALAARIAARDATTAALGPTRDTDQGAGTADGVDLVNLNNLYPSVSVGAITYPGIQQALKGAETADVVNSASDFDTILYEDPTGTEISIPSTGTFASPKTVTRIGGTYNVSTDNFRVTATRAANDATSVANGVVQIANVAATITVTEPAARLRSGGNNGTAAQLYTITITSDQELIPSPTLDPDSGGNRGTFTGGGFTGGPTIWTRSLQVDETVPDEKGIFTWENLVATNLAGLVTNTITGDATYELGGFVARTLVFSTPFGPNTTLGTAVVDFSKLTAGIFTATNQASIKQSIGTPPSVTNGYTIDALSTNPTTLIWLDTPAVNSNSTGTAAIEDVEETV